MKLEQPLFVVEEEEFLLSGIAVVQYRLVFERQIVRVLDQQLYDPVDELFRLFIEQDPTAIAPWQVVLSPLAHGVLPVVKH